MENSKIYYSPKSYLASVANGYILPENLAKINTKSSNDSGRKLDSSLNTIISDLNDSIADLAPLNFSYNKLEQKCKINYLNKATIGVNFYAYEWFNEKEAQFRVTDVGCDNYVDVKIDGIKYTDFYTNGADIYLDEATKIQQFNNKLAAEYERITDGYAKISNSLQNISDELSEISIPGINLSHDYSAYATAFSNINTKLGILLNNEGND